MSAEFSILSQSLDDWLSYLESIHYRSIDLGLERMDKVAIALDLKNLNTNKIITVTGTNGKGSVTNLLGKLLRNKGYKVCIYNSPHLIKFNERITIGDRLVTDEELLNAFRIIEAKRREINVSLTFFEFTTLAAFYIFKNNKSDFVILEVGMGGRYDSVNIVDADIAVITNVAIDHCAFLGSTRDEIGYQKVGIAKPGAVLIYGEADIPNSVVNYVQEINIPLVHVGFDTKYDEILSLDQTCWSYNGRYCYFRLPIPSIPIINVATVLTVLDELNINFNEQKLQECIECFKMPGRFQIISKAPYVIVDVGHNPHAFKFLHQKLEAIRKHHVNAKVYGVVGMLKDKDFATALNLIAEELDAINICSLSGTRGTNAKELALSLVDHSLDVSLFSDPVAGYVNALKKSSSDDIILVAGSFLTAGAVLGFCFPDYQEFLKSYS